MREKPRLSDYLLKESWVDETSVGDVNLRFLTVDVQKDHFYTVVRSWNECGASRLIACQKVFSWDALKQIQEEFHVNPALAFFSYLRNAIPELAEEVGTLRNYNNRRQRISAHMASVRKQIVTQLNSYYGSLIMVVDSMPIPSCRLSRAKRCRIFRH